MKKVLLVFLALVIIAVLLGGVAIFAGYAITNGDTNIRYVYVGDTNLSGLTKAQTEQLLIDKGWKEREETPLTVNTIAGESFTIDPMRTGVLIPLDRVVDQAYRYGHDSDMISNLIVAVKTFMTPVNISDMERSIDTDYIDGEIAACLERVQQKLGDAEYTVDPHAAQMTLVKG